MHTHTYIYTHMYHAHTRAHHHRVKGHLCHHGNDTLTPLQCVEVVEGKEECEDEQDDQREDGDAHCYRVALVKILHKPRIHKNLIIIVLFSAVVHEGR